MNSSRSMPVESVYVSVLESGTEKENKDVILVQGNEHKLQSTEAVTFGYINVHVYENDKETIYKHLKLI